MQASTTSENFVLLPGEAADHDNLLVWTNDRSPDQDAPLEIHELHCLKPYCDCGFVRFWIQDRAQKFSDITLTFRMNGSTLTAVDAKEDLFPFARAAQDALLHVFAQNPSYTEKVLASANAVRTALVNAERFRAHWPKAQNI